MLVAIVINSSCPFGIGWTKVEAIDSLMRKAGFSGPITESLRKRIRLTRYQSTLFALHYSDYASYVKTTRGAAPSILGAKPGNYWFFQTAFAKTAKLVWPKQIFKLKKKRKKEKYEKWAGMNLFVFLPFFALVTVINRLYHSSNSFDFEEGITCCELKFHCFLNFIVFATQHSHLAASLGKLCYCKTIY